MTMLNRAAALYSAAHEQREPEAARAADLRTLYDWDRDYHGSTRYASDRDYWLERLAGLEDGSTWHTATHRRLRRACSPAPHYRTTWCRP